MPDPNFSATQLTNNEQTVLRRELADCRTQLHAVSSELGELRSRRPVRLALTLAEPLRRLRSALGGTPAFSPPAPSPELIDPPLFYWPTLTDHYSPVPDTRLLSRPDVRARVWPEQPREVPGVDWREQQQLALLRELGEQSPMRIRERSSGDPHQYYAPNPSFGYYDSWAIGAMLRHLRPRRMIEVGSGWSSLLSARVNREYLDGRMELTCIEPYPPEFIEGVEGISRVLRQQVEQTPMSVFEQLGAGDVLFIDTTHTVKTGGDVVFLFCEVVPRLRPGVVVHVHDIFLPRDYPEHWALSGWGWNEQYLLEAFLAFNAAFEIVLAMAWLAAHHPDAVVEAAPAPEVVRRRFEASLWFRRCERPPRGYTS